jgi:hypothetical protein
MLNEQHRIGHPLDVMAGGKWISLMVTGRATLGFCRTGAFKKHIAIRHIAKSGYPNNGRCTWNSFTT